VTLAKKTTTKKAGTPKGPDLKLPDLRLGIKNIVLYTWERRYLRSRISERMPSRRDTKSANRPEQSN